MECKGCSGASEPINIKQISGMGTSPKVFAVQYQCKSCFRRDTYNKTENDLTPEERAAL
jgi:hypothetical protein